MVNQRGGKRRGLENATFGALNAILSQIVEHTNCSKRIFDFFGRILPIPQALVRGTPIKIMIPLNQVGVYNTFKTWETREPEVLDWIDGFEPGCTFFDVGASFGTETLYAALKKNGPDKIVAFDLSLESSFNLAYNISLNNIINVDQYFLALGDKNNVITFEEPTQYYYIKGRKKYESLPFNTLSISMDNFIQMSHLFPDYIKIDVDGAEQSIITGMSETLHNKELKSVVVEVSDRSEPSIIQSLENAGFHIEFSGQFEGEETRYKNIIFTRK